MTVNLLPPEPDEFPPSLLIVNGRGYIIPRSEFERFHLNRIWKAARTNPEARKFFTDRGLPAPRLQPRWPTNSDKSDA
jgi:hypothetical protein